MWLGIIVLSLLFLFVRIVFLHADPPRDLPNGTRTNELFVEGPAKALEARKYALKGSYVTNAADQYNFWRIQSPLYVLPLSWHLKIFGVQWLNVSLYGIGVSFLGFLAFLALLYSEGKTISLFAGGLFAALHYYAIHYSRVGLLEPQLNTLLTVCLFCCVFGQKRKGFLCAAPFVWMLAFLTKQSAVVFLPVLIVAMFCAGKQHKSDASIVRKHAQWIALGVMLTLLFPYVLQDAYIEKIAWNTHVAIADKKFGFSDMVASPFGYIGLFLSNTFSPRHFWLSAWEILPVTLPFALLHILRTARSVLRKTPVSILQLLSCIWFLSALFIIVVSFRVVVRYSVILFPPTFLLAAMELGFLAEQLRRKKKMRIAVLCSVLSFFVLIHMHWQSVWLQNMSYELSVSRSKIAKHLRSKDVMIGKRSPMLGFNSKADIFMMKGHFNVNPKVMSQLGITRILAEPEHVGAQRIRTFFPGALKEENILTEVFFHNRNYILYSLDSPLVRYF